MNHRWIQNYNTFTYTHIQTMSVCKNIFLVQYNRWTLTQVCDNDRQMWLVQHSVHNMYTHNNVAWNSNVCTVQVLVYANREHELVHIDTLEVCTYKLCKRSAVTKKQCLSKDDAQRTCNTATSLSTQAPVTHYWLFTHAPGTHSSTVKHALSFILTLRFWLLQTQSLKSCFLLGCRFNSWTRS